MKKIPPHLLRHLSPEQRRKLDEHLKKHEKFNQLIYQILDLLEMFFPRQPFHQKPLKLLYVHALATAGTLFVFPGAAESPPIAVVLVFCSSFCFAYILTALRVF